MSVLSEAPNRVLPALVTPLKADGQLDEASLDRLIDQLYNSGVGGLYVTGSTGEGIYLDRALRRRIVELAVAASRGRGQVIAHIGATQASHCFEMAAEAASLGADAVSSIPTSPGEFCWEEVLGFYRRLARSTRVPLVAYYIPGLTGHSLSLRQLKELLSLPEVAGMKFTHTDLYMLERLATHARPDQVIYNGPDQALALGLQAGARGAIGTTYNFLPRLIVDIFEHIAAGRHAEAMAAQKRVNEVVEVIQEFPVLAATKQILHWQGLLESTTLAPPRLPLNERQCAQLRERLASTVLDSSFVR